MSKDSKKDTKVEEKDEDSEPSVSSLKSEI